MASADSARRPRAIKSSTAMPFMTLPCCCDGHCFGDGPQCTLSQRGFHLQLAEVNPSGGKLYCERNKDDCDGEGDDRAMPRRKVEARRLARGGTPDGRIAPGRAPLPQEAHGDS